MTLIKTKIGAAIFSNLIAAHAFAQVKIGFTGPLPGPAAAIGQDPYDGFMLGVDRNVPVNTC